MSLWSSLLAGEGVGVELNHLPSRKHGVLQIVHCAMCNPLLKNPFENMKKMCKNCTHHNVVIGAANTAAPLYAMY